MSALEGGNVLVCGGERECVCATSEPRIAARPHRLMTMPIFRAARLGRFWNKRLFKLTEGAPEAPLLIDVHPRWIWAGNKDLGLRSLDKGRSRLEKGIEEVRMEEQYQPPRHLSCRTSASLTTLSLKRSWLLANAVGSS